MWHTGDQQIAGRPVKRPEIECNLQAMGKNVPLLMVKVKGSK